MSAKYDNIQFIERGRFATVLKATDKNTNQYVALKKMWMKSSLSSNFNSRSHLQSRSRSQSQSRSRSVSQRSQSQPSQQTQRSRSYSHCSQYDDQQNYFRHCIDREIRILKLVNNHPNIIKLINTFIEDEYIIIVFEYMNINLYQLLQNIEKNLTELQCKYISKQLFEGLHGLHSNNIIHRDLKPANILFNKNGLLKIADLGQARIVYNHKNKYKDIINHNKKCLQNKRKQSHNKPFLKRKKSNADNISINNMDEIVIRGSKMELFAKKKETNSREQDPVILINGCDDDHIIKAKDIENMNININNNKYQMLTNEVGTRWYKSPELLYGSRIYDSSLDIWSAGCIILEMLQNKPLFCGETDIDQLCKIFNILGTIHLSNYEDVQYLPDFNKIVFNKINAKNLNQIWPNLSKQIIDLVQLCLKLNPDQRISAFVALKHEWFVMNNDNSNNKEIAESRNNKDIDNVIMDHDKMQEIKQEAINLKELNNLIANATNKLNEQRQRNMKNFNKVDIDEADIVSITSEILNECDI